MGTPIRRFAEVPNSTPSGPVRSIEYEYTDDGKLWKRIWSRTSAGNRLTTAYTYDDDTGDLTWIKYYADFDGQTLGAGKRDWFGRKTGLV